MVLNHTTSYLLQLPVVLLLTPKDYSVKFSSQYHNAEVAKGNLAV